MRSPCSLRLKKEGIPGVGWGIETHTMPVVPLAVLWIKWKCLILWHSCQSPKGVPVWPWGLFGNNCRETAYNISSWELRLVLWVFSVGDSALCWNIPCPVVKEIVKGVMAVGFHQLVQKLGGDLSSLVGDGGFPGINLPFPQ